MLARRKALIQEGQQTACTWEAPDQSGTISSRHTLEFVGGDLRFCVYVCIYSWNVCMYVHRYVYVYMYVYLYVCIIMYTPRVQELPRVRNLRRTALGRLGSRSLLPRVVGNVRVCSPGLATAWTFQCSSFLGSMLDVLAKTNTNQMKELRWKVQVGVRRTYGSDPLVRILDANHVHVLGVGLN